MQELRTYIDGKRTSAPSGRHYAAFDGDGRSNYSAPDVKKLSDMSNMAGGGRVCVYSGYEANDEDGHPIRKMLMPSMQW